METSLIGLGSAFAFEASHVLTGYDGKCSRTHGHSYHGLILVAVPRDADQPFKGIALDFDILKAAIKACVMVYDHRHLNDFMDSPTAEVIARRIGLNLCGWFAASGGTLICVVHDGVKRERWIPRGVKVLQVKLHETANFFAVWTPALEEGKTDASV